MGVAHYLPYGEQLVMGSWRRRHQGRAEIRRSYTPHYELAIAKRSAHSSVENTLCRDAAEQRRQRFGFFGRDHGKAAGHRYYGERNGRDAKLNQLNLTGSTARPGVSSPLPIAPHKTGVVGDPVVAAILTALDMAAEGGRTAALDG